MGITWSLCPRKQGEWQGREMRVAGPKGQPHRPETYGEEFAFYIRDGAGGEEGLGREWMGSTYILTGCPGCAAETDFRGWEAVAVSEPCKRSLPQIQMWCQGKEG